MHMLRQYLQNICCLLAAVWVFAMAAGVIQGCLFVPQQEATHHGKTVAAEHLLHAAPISTSDSHDAALTSCTKYCEDSSVSTPKTSTSEVSSTAVLILVMYLLPHLMSPRCHHLITPYLSFPLAFLADPPATLRFHRFND